MKRLLIFAAAVVCLLVAAIGVFALTAEIAEHRKESEVAIEKKSLNNELLRYADFLKPGMTRLAVYQEMEKRSISFEQAHDSSRGSNQIILKKRMPSPVFYCSFEDLGIRMIFQPTEESGAPSSTPKAAKAGSQDATSPDDLLKGLDVHGQLMDCL